MKLLDYEISTLTESNNPFAVIILAHLQTLATRGKVQEQFQAKLAIVRRLYERDYTGEQIRQLFRFIEWMMTLPEELQQDYKQELKKLEEERTMPFITSFEMDGMIQGARKSVIIVLETRFESIPEALREAINQIEDLAQLKQFLKSAVRVNSLENFEQLLDEGVNNDRGNE